MSQISSQTVVSESAEQTIPDGYKQTEVGVIPQDWVILSIDDLSTKVGSGKTPTGGSSVYVESGRPFVRSQNVGSGNLRLADLAYITEQTHSTFTGSEIKIQDVLLNITGASIGRCALASPLINGGNVNQHVCIIRTNNLKVNPYLIQTLINSDSGQNQIDSFQAGGNREGLNFTQVRNIRFAFSNDLKEQTAIANALSDVDALLNEIEKLIAKKQAIKTATMQQLLTGKTRLPQFAFHPEVANITAQHNPALPENSATAIATDSNSKTNTSASASNGIKNSNNSTLAANNKSLESRRKGTKQSELGEIPEDWEVVKFGSIVNYIKGYPFKSIEYTDSGIRVVRVSDTSFTTIKNENPIFVSEMSKIKYKKWSLEKGNIIFTTVGSKPPMYDSLVGKAILVESHQEGFLLNQNAVLIKPKLIAVNISNLLISHFRTERYIDHIEKIYRGNANQASITLDGLFEFEIPLPTEPEEQTAIATVLSDMDDEIQALQQRLSKTRQIKQGMMQELLTGKTRLPFEKTNEQGALS